MGCWYSRIDREETVSRCKARKRYMKQLVKARQALAGSHSMYLRSLRGTGSALLQFSNNETTLHLHHHVPPPPAHPPPPMSPSSDTWTSATTASTALPPPPPPPPSSSWDFWDPFVPAAASRSATEEDWEATTLASEVAVTPTTTATGAASVAAPPSTVSGFSKDTGSDLALVVSRNSKELVEIVKEVDEYFLKAADAGGQLSVLLEVPNCNFSTQSKGGIYIHLIYFHFFFQSLILLISLWCFILSFVPVIYSGKVYNYGCNLTPTTWAWNWNQKMEGMGKLGEDRIGGNVGGGVLSTGHCSTIERLYAWEKKLYQEVKVIARSNSMASI